MLPDLAVTNLVQIVLILGITNLWAQSGMQARDTALFGVLLAVYDVVATSRLALTTEMLVRLAGLPLTPLFAWGSGSTACGLGLGDVLLATVFPLVMRKAFGRSAGMLALFLQLSAIGTLMALPLPGAFPVMVVLGPLMVLQYLFWRRRCGRERTTWQYVQEEPLPPQQVAKAAVHARSCSGEGHPSAVQRPRDGVQTEKNRNRQEVLR